jgi:hypothetical protein
MGLAVAAAPASELARFPVGPVCLEGQLSVAREFAKSWAVFAGRVVTAVSVPPAPPNWDEGILYRVTVDTVFRGSPGREIRLFNENSSGRFPMEVGTTYILFVYQALGRTVVDNCGNSMPLTRAEAVLDTLRQLSRGPRP